MLAGGQSLVPLLNLRLARPARIVDINRVAGLGVLRRSDGTLRIGATVRQAALERSALVAPALAAAGAGGAPRRPRRDPRARHRRGLGRARRPRGPAAGRADRARRALRAALGRRRAHARRRRVLPRPADDGARARRAARDRDPRPAAQDRCPHGVRRARAHARRLPAGRRRRSCSPRGHAAVAVLGTGSHRCGRRAPRRRWSTARARARRRRSPPSASRTGIAARWSPS